MILNHLQKPDYLPLVYLIGTKRTFILTEDLQIELSDGRWLKLNKGWKTDLMSVPQILWSLISPFDNGLCGDIIHDALWGKEQKQIEIILHGSAESAKKWSEYERKRWREAHAPNRKWITNLTHKFLRNPLVMLFYKNKIKIPT